MNKSLFIESKTKIHQLKKGEMKCLKLFSGIELSFNSFHSNEISFEHEAKKEVLEINHCFKGNIGWKMKHGISVYMGAGDLEIHTMDCCASSTMYLPSGYYEGITVLIDPTQFDKEILDILQNVEIDAEELFQKLCPHGEPLSLPTSDYISYIFSILYDVPERFLLSYCRLKVQELFFYLEQLEPKHEKRLTPYYSEQAELIKEIHDFLIKNTQKRFTIEELSKKYLINTTTLKSIFKGIYGKPIATYMKEYRMQEAMKLLRETNDAISLVAKQVGYENQGKFSTAFHQYTSILPTEYRKQYKKSLG